MSFIAECTSLVGITLHGCAELSNISVLASIFQLRLLQLFDANHVHDLNDITRFPHLAGLAIGDAPLVNGIAAVPITGQLMGLAAWRVPTVTSLDALVGSSLKLIDLNDCPVTNLEPLAMLQPLETLRLERMSAVNLQPLVTLPQLRELDLKFIDEPVDLSPLALINHRLRVELRNTSVVGDPGPLIKIRRR